jgi:hypothetical protein
MSVKAPSVDEKIMNLSLLSNVFIKPTAFNAIASKNQ